MGQGSVCSKNYWEPKEHSVRQGPYLPTVRGGGLMPQQHQLCREKATENSAELTSHVGDKQQLATHWTTDFALRS